MPAPSGPLEEKLLSIGMRDGGDAAPTNLFYHRWLFRGKLGEVCSRQVESHYWLITQGTEMLCIRTLCTYPGKCTSYLVSKLCVVYHAKSLLNRQRLGDAVILDQ